MVRVEVCDGKSKLLNEYHSVVYSRAVGIPRDRIGKQPVEVPGFGGSTSFTIGPRVDCNAHRAAKDDVVDARTSYHLLLWRL